LELSLSTVGLGLPLPITALSCISRAKVAGLRRSVKLFFLQQIHKQAPLTPTHWVGIALTQSTGDEKFSAKEWYSVNVRLRQAQEEKHAAKQLIVAGQLLNFHLKLNHST
jgi:hypothetical protein